MKCYYFISVVRYCNNNCDSIKLLFSIYCLCFVKNYKIQESISVVIIDNCFVFLLGWCAQNVSYFWLFLTDLLQKYMISDISIFMYIISYSLKSFRKLFVALNFYYLVNELFARARLSFTVEPHLNRNCCYCLYRQLIEINQWFAVFVLQFLWLCIEQHPKLILGLHCVLISVLILWSTS